MKSNSAKSPTEKYFAEEPDLPSPPEKRRGPEPPASPKWKNLTLDELKAWADEECTTR
jgi:hypothetical protein